MKFCPFTAGLIRQMHRTLAMRPVTRIIEFINDVRTAVLICQSPWSGFRPVRYRGSGVNRLRDWPMPVDIHPKVGIDQKSHHPIGREGIARLPCFRVLPAPRRRASLRDTCSITLRALSRAADKAVPTGRWRCRCVAIRRDVRPGRNRFYQSRGRSASNFTGGSIQARRAEFVEMFPSPDR